MSLSLTQAAGSSALSASLPTTQVVWWRWLTHCREGMPCRGKEFHPERRGIWEVSLHKPQEVQQAKGRVLPLGWGNPWYQHKLGWRAALPKRTWGSGGWEAGEEPAMFSCSPESQLCSGQHPKQNDQQGREGTLPPCSATISGSCSLVPQNHILLQLCRRYFLKCWRRGVFNSY